ncbi:MAG: lamin tail domain-containing protein [Prevotella sp.]|nr:lamin tail domain-containing protein [Prevotella sp.]
MKKYIFTLMATLALTTAHADNTLVINELMASNLGSVMSPAINFDSWIELYNPSNQSINLAGFYLSDDASNLKRWKMPSDIGTIPAKGFLVVWLGSDDIKSNQAPFKLDCDGGVVCISDKSGTLITSVKYPEALSRTAYARTTDGADAWGWTATPTPGASNAASVFATERLPEPVVSVDSKLFTGSFQVSVDIPEGTKLMYTTDGSLPQAPKGDEGDDETSPWTNWVKNSDCEGDDVTCLVGKDGNENGVMNTKIVDGEGHDGSRCVKVHAVANAADDWTTQFFVYTPDHIWNAGDKYRFHMWVRADKAAHISAQSHKKPGSYIHWQMLDGEYNITTEWQEIVYEGTITDQQAGTTGGGGWWWGGEPAASELQTIAFNLNEDKKSDNNFYFDDITWESYQGEGETTESSKLSKDGKFTVNKTTNYTFRLYKDGYLPSVPVTRSYIQTSNKYTLPVISIVGDKKYFTDPKIGLDCDGDGTNGKTGNGQDWPRNYNQPWDRPVNFSYMTPDGEMLFNQDANIKVSGGWTRSQRYRSFKLKANKVFDGQNRFDFSFFPQKPFIRNKTILLRNGGNDYWTHNARFMDPALETIIQRSGIDLDVQSSQPVIEYVNGELRGVFNLREPNNDGYAYANWGYDDDELDAFENMVMKNGTDSVLNVIFDLARDINADGNYEQLTTMLDIDEFTNYMAVTMFLDNDDWPNNNMKAYRSQNDGRYRFVSFDLDYAFSLRNFNTHNDDPFAYFLDFKDANTVNGEGNWNKEIVNLFLNLLGHDAYRRKFIDTFCLIGGSVFEPTRAGAIVDELLNNVKAMCQLMKQQGINDGHDPDRAATTIKSKLSGRSTKMTNCLKKFSYAKLSGVLAQNVTLKADTEGARLYVNGILVPYADFQGQLFAPVLLSAEAPAGYRFAGWKQGSSVVSTEAEFSLPQGTVSLTATFTPLSEEERSKEGITPVRINEVSAANGIFVNDLFKRNDWIELYNTTSADIDIQGMYLSDNLEKPHKYQIEQTDGVSTVIPAHGYLVVWCDKLDPLSQLHASFKLAAEGGDILLTAADESWSDRISYTAMNSDETVGRYPDGSSNVFTMNVPTIAKTNMIGSYAVSVSQPDIDGISDLSADDSGLLISYAAGRLVIRTATPVPAATLSIYNMSGQSLQAHSIDLSSGYAELSLDRLASGCFIARLTDGIGHITTCKFIHKQ